MKKVLVVLVFALLAIGLITPKIIAPRYQQTVADLVARINAAPGYSAKIESTELAWFGSESKLSIGYDITQVDPSIPDGKLAAEFILETHYGPLLFDQQGLFGLYSAKLRLPGDKQREFLSWDEKQPLYQLSVLGGFTGKLNMLDNIPAFSDKAQTFQFAGYSGKAEKKGEKFHYVGKIAEINTKGSRLPIMAKDISLAVDLDTDISHLLNSSLYNGETSISLGKLNIAGLADLEGITLLAGSKLDDSTQLGSINLGYLVKHLAFADFKASDLALQTEFTHLNNDFFKKYDNFTTQALGQNNSPEVFTEDLVAFMQENIDELLVSKPEFNITKFSGTMDEGRFEASLTSKFADMESPTPEEFQTPNFWLYNLIAQAKIAADAPLVNSLAARFLAQQMGAPFNSPEVTQQAQSFIDHFIQQGFIKRKGNEYLSEIKLEKGQGQVYEQSFPLL